MTWVLQEIGLGAQLSPDLRYLATNGTLFFVLIVILVRSLGVSARQKAKLSLQEAEMQFQQKAIDSHVMLDIADDQARITYVNEHILESTGFSADELLGKTVDHIHLDQDDGQFEEVRASLQAGNAWSGETKLATKSGDFLWTHTTIVPMLNRRGKLIKTLALRTDTTESHRAAAERHNRAMLETLRDAVYVFTTDTLELTYVNQAALDMHGWQERDVAGKRFTEIPKEFDAALFESKSAMLISGSADVATCEVTVCGCPVEINLQLQDHGSRPCFVAVARDISERKRADAEKSAFVASVSHELRSPLTSIKGALGLIRAGAAGQVSEKSQGMLDIASRNIDRLIALINDLLDLEKLNADMVDFHMEEVDLGGLIGEAVECNRMFADGLGVTLQASAPAAPVSVTGDRDRLMQVLTNLLSNSAKFSPEGSAVDIRLESKPGAALISVVDRGIGIPQQMQSRIFDRFAQADTEAHRKRPGTGLGLSIVKSIVTRHEGRVWVESTENVGTTFFVEFPASTSREMAA